MSKHNWRKKALELHSGGMSWRSIAREIGKSKSTVSDFLRKKTKGYVRPSEKVEDEAYLERSVGSKSLRSVRAKEDNSRILLISDMHIPYHHPDLIPFLQHLKDKYSPTRVVCLGDELDKHALSYHDSDPDLMSAGDELRKSLPVIKKLKEMFPVMDLIESNHGSLVWRKAKTHGIPRHYIKSYNEVLGVDEGWKWHYDLVVDLPNGQRCYIHHGKTNNVLRLSQQMGMSAVQGHYHEILKADYWGNPNGLHWGLQAGCLIDDKSYAFSYNNVNIKRPVIGTALIIDGLPVLEPMIVKNGRWIGIE